MPEKRYCCKFLKQGKNSVKQLCSSITFTDPVNTRRVHKELMNKVRNEAIHISNKYKVQIEPLHFEWDRFIPTLEKKFPDILNEMLYHNSQQQPLN